VHYPPRAVNRRRLTYTSDCYQIRGKVWFFMTSAASAMPCWSATPASPNRPRSGCGNLRAEAGIVCLRWVPSWSATSRNSPRCPPRNLDKVAGNGDNPLFPLDDGDPYGTRTRVFAVRGRRPRPLDEGASADAKARIYGRAGPSSRWRGNQAASASAASSASRCSACWRAHISA
jgi:hypothetical protein